MNKVVNGGGPVAVMMTLEYAIGRASDLARETGQTVHVLGTLAVVTPLMPPPSKVEVTVELMP